MQGLTYNQLAKWIASMTPEQRMLTATIFDPVEDEFHPVTDIAITLEDDVLDKDHPMIVINTEDEDEEG
ncbi:hypothetical protein E6Q11_05155 [Candidatus Dojkabacteria bacterium]|uniref:Uncharacterized protein n=1 Tax=Candidatus Dojkabacteria bacterium TaxID=2099670 RepID=A0A5C7J3Y3_9BACT|nr:MAG: hypothetical protein E6Q11_05155 [Candidatus Dojkabacteria bacterium]